MYYDLEDLVGKIGKGIYYLTSCRSLKCDVSDEKLNAIWHGSQNQQNAAESPLGAISSLNNTPQERRISGEKRRRINAASSADGSAITANNVTHKKRRLNIRNTRKLQHKLDKLARRYGLKRNFSLKYKNKHKHKKLKWRTPGRK